MGRIDEEAPVQTTTVCLAVPTCGLSAARKGMATEASASVTVDRELLRLRHARRINEAQRPSQREFARQERINRALEEDTRDGVPLDVNAHCSTHLVGRKNTQRGRLHIAVETGAGARGNFKLRRGTDAQGKLFDMNLRSFFEGSGEFRFGPEIVGGGG